MFRFEAHLLVEGRSFPRVRGDVPAERERKLALARFSPRARGCSLVQVEKILPNVRFPRVRGDVPHRINQCDGFDTFSPRARGCSALRKRLHA